MCMKMKKIFAFALSSILISLCSADPVGLDAYNNIESLPEINPLSFASGFSSYQRNGGNEDRGNFLYQDGSGYVMAEISGPGTIYRLWTTGQNGYARIRFYLDGVKTPQYNKSFSIFYDGKTAPFLSPLNGDNFISSGGFYSYLPITFSNSCKITSTDKNLYYNIGILSYPGVTNINTWTGSEDSSSVCDMWNNAGDPVGSYTNTLSVTSSFNLLPGESKVIADISGQRLINSIRIINPDISITGKTVRTVTDDGRAFKGYSKFVMSIPTSNNGVRLVRRMDNRINDQKSQVSIDGVDVGEWYDEGGAGYEVWFDSSFWIPESFTEDKNVITVKVTFVSSQIDWNEFTYWTYASLGTEEMLSDTLDVKNTASESAHNYSVVNQVWEGTRTFKYYDTSFPDNLSWATGVWIQAEWDSIMQQAVNSPVGMFFGNGFDINKVRAFLFGFKTNNLEHYSYFPMPFGESAVIILTNRTDRTFSNIWCEVQHSDFQTDIDESGWFHATYHSDIIGSDGHDYNFLNVNACGKFVGVVHSMKCINYQTRGYLEGDERFYIDGSKTPAVYGTGTEDYYNGGWYFDQGTFTLPTHGNPYHNSPGGNDLTSCYRLHWPDTIPFRSSIRAGVEHGPNNDVSVEYSSVSFWYGKPDVSYLSLIDSIDIGNPLSEATHLYTNGGHTVNYSMTSSYEGDDSDIMINDTGRVYNSFSQFRVAVNSDSKALLIRRRGDHSFTNQMVNVEVNGLFAGKWLLAGYNPYETKWVDDEFIIPSEFFANSYYADIKLTATNGAVWSEFRYDIYAILNPAIPEPVLFIIFYLSFIIYYLRKK